MKHSILYLAFGITMLSFAACNNKAQEQQVEKIDKSDTVATVKADTVAQVPAFSEETAKEQITERFNLLYKKVLSRGNNNPNLEKEFTSKAYYALYQAAEKPCGDAEIGYFDYDHWTQTQGTWCPRPVIKNIKIIDEKHAILKFTIPFKDEKPADVTFKYFYERDNWYIDDINDEVKGMKEYIG